MKDWFPLAKITADETFICGIKIYALILQLHILLTAYLVILYFCMPDPFCDGMADTGTVLKSILFQTFNSVRRKIEIDPFFIVVLLHLCLLSNAQTIHTACALSFTPRKSLQEIRLEDDFIFGDFLYAEFFQLVP